MKPTYLSMPSYKNACRRIRQAVLCVGFMLALLVPMLAQAQPQNLQISNGLQKMVVGSSYLLLDPARQTPFYASSVALFLPENRQAPLTPQQVSAIIAKQKGVSYALPDVTNIGFKNEPVWMVLPVYNRTYITDWDLHLGYDLGFHAPRVSDVKMYQAETGAAMPVRVAGDGHVVISLPRQSYTTILVRIDPQEGWPVMLRPVLQPAGTQPPALFSPVDGASKIAMGLSILLIALFLVSLRFEQLFLGVASLLQVLMVSGICAFGGAEAFAAAIIVSAQAVLLAAGVAVSTNFRQPSELRKDKVVKTLFVATALVALLGSILMMLFVNHAYVISLLMYIAAQILASVMAFHAGLKKYPAAWLLFLAVALPVVGAALALPVAFNMPVGNEIFMLSVWVLTLVFQSLLLLATNYIQFLARPKHYSLVEHKGDQDEGRNGSELREKLKASQDTYDHERLLRVLEQERIQMQVLRESEHKKTEEMRIAKEAADEANRARSAFFAVISHEIRTPMNGVLGMVRLLLQTSLNKDQKNYATTIQESGQTMMTILNDILDLEKIERGKMTLETIEVDLHQLLHSLHTLLLGHAVAKNIDLRLELSPSVPRFIMSDPTRLRQILLNLLSNAVKFTERGGVTLIVRPMEGDEATQSPKRGNEISLYFAVQDSGVGISLQAQRNLFSPFVQAEASTARKFGGSGLGLVICQKLVERMGGEINVQSREGEGSTFFFVLPFEAGDGTQFAAAEVAEREAVASEMQALKEQQEQPVAKLRIAIIDDNEINHKVLSGYLEPQGHALTHFYNATETTNGLRANPHGFDLILMDLEMPDGNGMDVTRAVREAGVLAPIMALTGHTDEEIIRACMDSGMNDYLPKPVEPATLERIVRNTIAGEYAPPVPYGDLRDVPVTGDISLGHGMQSYATAPDQDDEFSFALPKSVEQSVVAQSNPNEAFDSPLFNTSMLAPLKDSLGEAGMEELLADLYKTCEETLLAMNTALESGNMQEIMARGHDLKGMAGNFGLTDLSNRAAEIDNAIRHNEDLSAIPEKVKSLTQSYEDSRQALESWIKS